MRKIEWLKLTIGHIKIKFKLDKIEKYDKVVVERLLPYLFMFTHLNLDLNLPELEASTTEDGRTYTTPDGNVYPSITTVLSVLSKDGIQEWQNRVGLEEAERIREHAANRGTDLHQILEDYINNKPVTFPTTKLKIMFNRMKRPLRNVSDVIAQEVPLYSDALKIAGRCDLIAAYKGINSIIDFKGSGKAKKEEWIQSYFQQATGYSLMFEERTGICIEQIVI